MATSDARAGQRSPAQYACLAVASVFLLVGVLGFVPGITTGYDTLVWAGHHTDAKLLGLFQVSALHNIIHLGFGFAGVSSARVAAQSRGFLIGGGLIYLVLWLYGLLIDPASDVNFIPVNTADNWLHFVLGLAMVALGLFLPWRDPARISTDMRPGNAGPLDA
ncbi:DUF4383 domain-containing protein [Nocardia sp. CDC159]|uniref:DUF4383 domain-containing protein n=1 Tax=Nocardia pulmonis TaxID=2951408 RepID=A0A9X2J2A2_9NOCA|nr:MULTISPECIES: DUF4383 domain-containing protein [Nocardia]MCM6778960.1 DUF4383 domain-containing protein [Nocardia pulmonis]MCM6791849.1 DUF4383 domain-containing protein [Nocardia sp. CDC159]